MNGLDQKLMRALALPLRCEILRILEQEVSSPTRMAKLLGEPVGSVSYHTKVLLQADCIELWETVPRRGAVEHVYKLKGQVAIGARTWKAIPPSLRTHYAGTALADFTNRAVEAMEAGTVESREGSGLTCLPLKVDEQGWEELRQVLGNVEERFRAVADQSVGRMGGPGKGFPLIVAVAAFEMADGVEDGPA